MYGNQSTGIDHHEQRVEILFRLLLLLKEQSDQEIKVFLYSTWILLYKTIHVYLLSLQISYICMWTLYKKFF